MKQIRNLIFSDDAVVLGSGNPDDQKTLIDELISSYVWKVQRDIAARRLAKRKFVARISRPSLSRAFFSWKFACRQSSAATMPSSGLFAEPQLPWNVRHPRSRFTGVWEGIQAIVLVYVAFSVVFRVCLNVPAVGLWAVLEGLIDFYFLIDVLLQAHTGSDLYSK